MPCDAWCPYWNGMCYLSESYDHRKETDSRLHGRIWRQYDSRTAAQQETE